MSSNQTTNYQLHQWEPTDDFLREEINENFALLDTSATIIGTYTGNGETSQEIILGRRPRAVLLCWGISFYGDANTVSSGIFGDGYPMGGTKDYARVTATGFSVGTPTYSSNINGRNNRYYYIALF